MAGKRMRSDARREQLLDQSREIVASEGFPALTIDRLAREAGLTRTPIYVQFGSLDGLVTALVQRETAVASAGLAHVTVPAGDVSLDDIATYIGEMLDVVTAAPRSWHILLTPPEGGPPDLHEQITAGRALARGHIASILREIGRPSGHPLEDDLDLTAHLLHVAGEELIRLHLRDPEQYPKARVVRQASAIARTFLAARHVND
jgi:AcrR family transcriptional regulator